MRWAGSGRARVVSSNLPFMWGAQPRNGLISFNDVNSGLWLEAGEKIDKRINDQSGR